MSTRRVLLAVSASVGLGAARLGAQGSATDVLPSQLDRRFAEVDSSTTPGCVIGVTRGTQPPLYRSYGMADLERPTPNDTTTVFEAGSVSKQFVAAAVLLLSYEGRLALDDDVRRFIPEFPAAAPRTTIRQLLTHQSGLRDYGDLLEFAGWPRGTRLDTQDEVLALITRQSGRNFTPGSEYSYSNSNYVVAVALVARAAGEPFARFMQRAVFAPLGMTHTQWRDDITRRVPGRAVGWTPDDAGTWAIDMPHENVVGHGGLLTTVPDLLRWQRAFTSGAFGGPRFALDMERTGVLTNGRTTGYALGLEVATERGVRTVSHGGWTAGYKSYVGRIPAHDLSVALLCNAGSLRTDLLGPQLLALADGDTSIATETPPDLGPADRDGAGSRIAGLFRNERTRQPVTVRAFRDGLTINTWVAWTPAGTDRYRNADGTRVLSVQRARDGGVASLQIVSDGRDSVRFGRVMPWAPSRADLATLAGRWASADVEGSWALAVDHDSLVVLRRGGRRDVLVPRYTDAFAVPSQGWLVTLRRDRRGRVIAIDVGLPRTRTITYRRTPSIAP